MNKFHDRDCITVVDPIGITIGCTQSQWDDHVTTGQHPDMKIDDVKNTIADPEYIHKSSDPYAKIIHYFSTVNKRNLRTHVVAKVSGSYGDVVTAYPVKKVSGSNLGEVIYDKNKL